MKTINIPNQNNKLAADIFGHITFSPTVIDPVIHIPVPRGIPESDLPIAFNIQSTGAPVFVANLITFARCKLIDLSSIETLLASGLERDLFIQKFISENKNATYHSEVAVYIYQKVLTLPSPEKGEGANAQVAVDKP